MNNEVVSSKMVIVRSKGNSTAVQQCVSELIVRSEASQVADLGYLFASLE